MPTVCLVSASHQNVFFTELLDAFGDALSGHGLTVERALDCFPPVRDDLVYVFVPHELLPFLMPDGHPTEPQLQRSITICTEQPGTHWFDEDARIAKRAAAAVDINSLGVAALKKEGVDAQLLRLGYVPAWDYWHGEASERPVDLTFQGGATPRRLMAMARCGRLLAGRQTEIHMFESLLPHRADSEHFLSGSRKWEMLARSKVLMNVHRSELGYLEWQRAVGAMVNGCVLLSEHSLGFEPLVPGEHFISASYDSLDVALEGLLNDEERLARIRESAYKFLRDEHPLSVTIEVLAELASDVARKPVAGGSRRALDGIPRPKPPQVPPTEYERLAMDRDGLSVLRMAAKQILLDQREVRAAIRDLQSAITGGGANLDEVERFGPSGKFAPRVSVVVPVYNYAALVGTAIRSVAVGDFEDYELVVIDDASSDGSGDVIRSTLVDETPWVRATVITRQRNRGLARARNLGAEAAAGELLFMLDADNEIYPHALGHLAAALDERPDAAFSYGIIEQFGVSNPSLMSYLGWDPERLKYGNFVDAMAMMRRSALLDAGGYTTDPRLYGWEDFALWCEFADRGWRGLRVPEIVARYRVALQSMISLTNIDATAAWSVLLERFACLSVSVDASVPATAQ